MKVIDRIALVLVIIGGLNWGSIGIFGLDIVAALFGGSASGLSRLVYILVCLSSKVALKRMSKRHIQFRSQRTHKRRSGQRAGMRKIQPNPLIGGETENAYVSSAIQERTNRGTVFQNIVPLFSVLAQKKKQTIQISLTENEKLW